MDGLIQVSTSASYEELRAAEDRIKEQLAKVADAARAEALATIVSSIKEFNFTAEELNDAIEGKVKKTRGRPAKIQTKVAGASAAERKKAAPKYRNPVNPTQTWTGRGIAPAWIKNVAKEDRDVYLIPVEATTEPEASLPEAATTEPEQAPQVTETRSVFEDVTA